jgi:hypothetical protein
LGRAITATGLAATLAVSKITKIEQEETRGLPEMRSRIVALLREEFS